MRIHKRERLEIIVDSCSLGHKGLRGVEKLLDYALGRKPQVIGDYSVVMPIQLGTEVRQRLFPEFLQAELRMRRGDRGLDAFYKRHEDKIRIVETASSYAYKFYYAKGAAAVLLAHPEMHADVLAQANILAERYAPYPGAELLITADDLAHYLAQITTRAHAQDRRMSETLVRLHNYHNDSDVPPQVAHVDRRIAERKNLARHAAPFFQNQSLSEQYLLQAMYTEPTLNAMVTANPAFTSFRRDIGERAIEDYLYDRRAEPDPGRVSLVISEDRAARLSIHRLREQTHNTVFVISSWGLAVALKELKLIGKLNTVTNEDLIGQVYERTLLTHSKRVESRRAQGKPVTSDDVLEPPIERKWAHRLVELVKYGEWSSQIPRQHATR